MPPQTSQPKANLNPPHQCCSLPTTRTRKPQRVPLVRYAIRGATAALAWQLFLACVPAPAKAADEHRRLFLDQRVIEKSENVHVTIGTVKKHPANPLFSEDKPWEMRFDNLYANVIYDEQEKIYKCWYSPFIVDNSSRDIAVEDRKNTHYYKAPYNREMGICYAVSADGLKWTKPEMGLVEYEGSKANNILWRGTGPVVENEWFGPHGTGIFKDLRDPDPERRYKAILKRDILSVAFSPDGIRWDTTHSCPEADSAGDTHNNAFWAPTLGRYVGITRQWDDAENVRQVAVTYSDDFIRWSKSEVVLQGITANHQVYAMPVFYYAGVYLGLAAIHDQTSDRVWTELTWSADTRKWHRISPGTPLIGNDGKEGDYDWGCVYSAATPVILKDEIRIYYGSSDGKHHGWRNGHFCLATLRPDGWAGMEPRSPDDPGYVLTRPLVVAAGPVLITADVTPGGSVVVSCIDEAGNVAAQSAKILATVTDAPITWDRALPPGPYRLRFDIDQAKLYSFVTQQ